MKNFYQSTPWRKLRKHVLDNSPICIHCYHQKGIVTPATEVDHIIPIKINKSLALEYANLQPLCGTCHKRKTVRENRNKMQVKEVDRMNEKMKDLLR